jgi:hypothetical protein
VLHDCLSDVSGLFALLYYLPRIDEIINVRVVHGARDIASIAKEGGFAI